MAKYATWNSFYSSNLVVYTVETWEFNKSRIAKYSFKITLVTLVAINMIRVFLRNFSYEVLISRNTFSTTFKLFAAPHTLALRHN